MHHPRQGYPGWAIRAVAWASGGGMPVLLAVLLALPTLGVGWLADDYVHRAAIQGAISGHPGGLELYDFADGNLERMALAQDQGFPWWTAPDLKVRFLRPLSSALTRIDHQLLGETPWLAHLLSVLCYAVLVAGVALLMRRILPRGSVGAAGLAGLATLLFAVDDSHAMAVAWAANRNAVVATGFVVWGMVAWLRYREDGWPSGEALAWLLWVAGLAAGETALGAMALPGAYELLGGREPSAESWRSRAQRLLPFALLAQAYLTVYKLGNYGSFHSSAYIDPLRETAQFAGTALVRVPMMLGALIARVPVELAVIHGEVVPAMAVAGGLAAAALVWLVAGVRSLCDAVTWRHLRWLFAGSLLALLPAAATFPAHRLLVVPSIGLAAALAVVFLGSLPGLAAALGTAQSPVSTGRQAAAVLLAVLHLALAPVIFVGSAQVLGWVSGRFEGALRAPALAGAVGRTVVLPAAPDLMTVYQPVAMRGSHLPHPRRWWTLTTGREDCMLRVVDAHTVELRPERGVWLATDVERLLRSRDLALRPGDTVRVRGFSVAILQADALGNPHHLQVTFDQRLDDPDLVWLSWGQDGVEPLKLPPLGQWLRLPRSRWLGI